jgi:hypothetical protein
MHYYRGHHIFFITSTASERITDISDCFPHKSLMPQLTSTDRLVMKAQYMTDAVKHPHPGVIFSTIGYYTITSLVTLADILKTVLKACSDNTLPASTGQGR